MLGAKRVVGVFASPSAAQRARELLLGAGVPPPRVAISVSLTEDGIAAEHPGQAYENQPGQAAADSALARYGEEVRSGACVVSVLARSDEERYLVEGLMRSERAYRVRVLP